MKNFVIVEDDALKLGRFLKEARSQKKMTITDLENESGINRADIHRLEGGQKKRLNPFQLVSLAEALEINLIDLYILVGFISKKAITDFVKKKTDERISEQLKIISYTGAIKIPVFEDFLNALDLVKNSEPIKYTTLFLNEDTEYVGIIIKEDTLTPLISKDAIVILEKTKNIQNGDLAVFSIDDIFYIRRFFEKDNVIILSHINSSYEPIIVTNSTNFNIHGKLVVTINEI
ncbi:MAG: helix-turn-helix domain-containing protein [Fusobacteriaceae bacterium]|nr:helix-turn-helix domain-containing protein [Fusobacteriaceae bacterium]MBP6467413.1 helix-turn-helix domain-containing protein [Fusobacteriaceae bacterium]MBP9595628.1 helix-turn-helix domain-containing protein [Fusobacteriaceae bacterium]MBU9917267.1 helix-turn-helix domain-containing protein [Fusobacteriaceae bacterium]